MGDARARLDFTHAGRVARLTLSAPRGNILDAAMIRALDGLTATLAGRRDLCAIVVAADGPHFSFGASVEEHLPDRIAGALAALHALLRRIADLPAPTIAAVRGQCLGGGLELVLACDLIVAEENAKFGCPEIKLGVFPPAAAALLPVRVGLGRASALVLSGESISGRDAAAAGLVAELVPARGLDERLERWISRSFVSKSPTALRLASAALRHHIRRALNETLAGIERLYLEDLMREPDAEEGIRAFLEKRLPQWHPV
jgi:cyclohexa-1,5-dienecarbonyl-CoA hydratase